MHDVAHDTERWHRAVRSAVLDELSALGAVWREADGELRGPGGHSLRVAERHPGGPGHADLCFDLGSGQEVWDCVVGFGEDLEAAARMLARIWAGTSAPALLELTDRRGRFADHAHGDDGLGLARWHSIHGPILAYGSGDPHALQRWLLEHPVVPSIADDLRGPLAPGALHAVKVFVGALEEPIAEVRIDGERHDLASAALMRLDWPRTPVGSVARQLVLFLHEE